MTKATYVAPTPPREDPVNSMPRTEQGYPVRIASRGDEIFYVPTDIDRNIMMMAEEGIQELDWFESLPTWKKWTVFLKRRISEYL